MTDLIRSGELEAGRRLPSIRQLAGDLRLATGTVARAYRELEAMGLIESSRSGGTRVLPGQESSSDVRLAAEDYAARARHGGAGLDDALSAVRIAWDRMNGRPRARSGPSNGRTAAP